MWKATYKLKYKVDRTVENELHFQEPTTEEIKNFVEIYTNGAEDVEVIDLVIEEVSSEQHQEILYGVEEEVPYEVEPEQAEVPDPLYEADEAAYPSL